MFFKKFFRAVFLISLLTLVMISASGWSDIATGFDEAERPPDLSQLPELDIWPGKNDLGPSDLVGNPLSISLTIDNQTRPLTDLDLNRVGLFFDSLDVTSVLFTLPANAYLIDGNRLVINIRDIPLPDGTFELRMEAANQDGPLQTITRTLTIQKDRGFHVGMHIPPVEDWEPPYNDWSVEINRLNELSGRHHTLIMYYTSWADENDQYIPLNSFLNNQIVGMGAVPLITWEPWRAGAGSEQPDYGHEAIINGHHDPFLIEFAQHCIQFGKPLILRLMHEFNGIYYPWSGYRNNNNPQLFIAAFRHIVDLFRQQGATNVSFMWSPNFAADQRVPYPSSVIDYYYPGDDYVDWIGASGYNWGLDRRVQAQGWLDFLQIYDSDLFGRFLTRMQQKYPDKKIIIAEIGSNEGDQNHSKADWIRDAYSNMGRYANIGGVTWFNDTAYHDAANILADFRIMANPGDSTSPADDIMAAYRLAVDPNVPPLPPASAPVYRLDARGSFHYLFTTNEIEKNALMESWHYAGIAFNAFITQVAETLPVYRLRNRTNSGFYFTMDGAEKDRLLAGGIWEGGEIAWYAYPKPAEGAIPCYRFRSHPEGLHFYTADSDEKSRYEASSVWQNEGPVFYVMPSVQ